MLDPRQKAFLFLSFVPYLCLGLYDGWLHDKARQVPRLEQVFHAVLAISVGSLLLGLFFDRPKLIRPALVGVTVAALADEFGFHGTLPRHERRIHFAAYTCFALFIAVAVHMGALA
jgi:hypothetical protein